MAGAAAAFVLFALAGRLVQALARRAPRPRHPGLRLAVANLHRPGAPTNSVVLSLGLGLTVLIAIAQVEGNLGDQLHGDLADEAPFAYRGHAYNRRPSISGHTPAGGARD